MIDYSILGVHPQRVFLTKRRLPDQLHLLKNFNSNILPARCGKLILLVLGKLGRPNDIERITCPTAAVDVSIPLHSGGRVC